MINQTDNPYKIFVITGESSGDQIAAGYINHLKKQHPKRDFQIEGIGGDALKKQGLEHSLFPLESLSLMGIAEIIPHIPDLLDKIRQTAWHIHQFKPDLVLSVDAPDFSFRVLKRYQKRFHAKGQEGAPRFEHIVAPTVWAWRPGRAKKIAKLLDHLHCLFPFEPPYFEAVGLSASYWPHPFLPLYRDAKSKGQAFRKANNISEDKKLIGIFPGSRKSELSRMLPVFRAAMEMMHAREAGLQFVLLTLPHLKPLIEKAMEGFTGDFLILDDIDQKPNMMGALDAGFATSGTIGFELSLARVPHLVAYKMNSMTRFLAAPFVKTPYMHLTNIHLKKKIIPEFFQAQARSEIIADTAQALLHDETLRQAEAKAFEELWAMLEKH